MILSKMNKRESNQIGLKLMILVKTASEAEEIWEKKNKEIFEYEYLLFI